MQSYEKLYIFKTSPPLLYTYITKKKGLTKNRSPFSIITLSRVHYTLISTSTPLGNSSFINASTVFVLFE